MNYPDLAKFLLILSVNVEFRLSFIKECSSQEERHRYLREHAFDPDLILSQLKQFSDRHGSSGSSSFFKRLTNLSTSQSLSTSLSELLSCDNNHSFLFELFNLSVPLCDESVFASTFSQPDLDLQESYSNIDRSLWDNSINKADQSQNSKPPQIICNICGSKEFLPFGLKSRLHAQCKSCHSLERHRALHLVLQELGLLNPEDTGAHRILHLAPEDCTYNYLSDIYGTGYIASDPCPESYKNSQCLNLIFPDNFSIFPSQYFRLILHNHVLEHLYGSYVDHINEFYRLLDSGGYLIFSFPDLFYQFGLKSIEGGELLSSDVQRRRLFGQRDHVKWLGIDFVSYLHSKFTSVNTYYDPRKVDNRSLMIAHNAIGIIFVCRK